MNIQNKIRVGVSCIALAMTSACSGGNSGGGSGGGGGVEPKLSQPVRLSHLGVVPASDSNTISYLAQITNYTDDKYTLESIQVLDPVNNKASKLITVGSQTCSIIPAKGGCSLQITPHSTKSGDAIIKVNLKDSKGKQQVLTQIVRVSSKLKAETGKITMLNDVDRILTEDGNFSLSIPVILGDSYDKVTAANGSLVCNTGSYLKGSSCTYQLSGKVTGKNSTIATHLEGIKNGKPVAIKQANTKVVVGKGAHLLLAHGVEINHPSTKETLAVYNAGNEAAKNIQATTADAGLRVEAGSCGNTLDPNTRCALDVSVVSEVNGHGNVNVAYQNQQDEAYVTVTNVGYNVDDSPIDISIDSPDNDLPNALVGGSVREATIIIQNKGKRKLESLSVDLAPQFGDIKIAGFACPSGKLEIGPGEECGAGIEYKATTKVDNGSINFILNGRYTDHLGITKSYVAKYGLSYSADYPGSLILATKNGGAGNLKIKNNASDVRSAVWSLKNPIAANEGIKAKLLEDMQLSTSIDKLTVTPATNCGKDAEIGGQEACDYTTTYGPVSAEQPETKVSLATKYQYPFGTVQDITSSEFAVRADVTGAGIETVLKLLNTPLGLSGDGLALSPWTFINQFGMNQLKLEYTFTNEGPGVSGFNVDLGASSSYAEIDNAGTTCKYGINQGNLGENDSCKVVLSVLKTSLTALDKPIDGTIYAMNFSLPFSYTDSDGKLVHDVNDTSARYFSVSRNWLTFTHNLDKYESSDAQYHFLDTKFEITPDPSLKLAYPIDVELVELPSGVTAELCQLADASQTSCIVKVKADKAYFNKSAKFLATPFIHQENANPLPGKFGSKGLFPAIEIAIPNN